MHTKIAEVLKREIRKTEDGSSTIFIPELNEGYHSTHGAVQESRHVFIEAGLKLLKERQTIKILEMGFGTGLNCLLSYLECKGGNIVYYGVEKYPVEKEMVKKLNYPEKLKLSEEETAFYNWLHACSWNKEYTHKAFKLVKVNSDMLHIEPKEKFNLVYFDAFAPEVQPQLWGPDMFALMHSLLDEGGILTTYCAKGQVRRNMLGAGFKVERLPGPPGKREMLRAIKDIQQPFYLE